MGAAIQVGGVYSVVRSTGFGIVRVLAYQPQRDMIVARTYKARFVERLRGEDISEGARDPAVMLKELEMSIGALPVTPRVFEYWQPEFMFHKPINEEEKENLEKHEVVDESLPWDELRYP